MKSSDPSVRGDGKPADHITWLWKLPGDGSSMGDIVAALKDGELCLVLCTKPGTRFGDDMVLVLVRNTYGWAWEGDLSEAG